MLQWKVLSRSVMTVCLLFGLGLSVRGGGRQPVANGAKPNVIFVLTDDQGYGDLGCHGNPVLKTPNLDRLHNESVRYADFHVSSFCTPTRGALMTGRNPGRNGACRTSSRRTMLLTDEQTIADIFSESGCATGMVGQCDRGFKQHLSQWTIRWGYVKFTRAG